MEWSQRLRLLIYTCGLFSRVAANREVYVDKNTTVSRLSTLSKNQKTQETEWDIII